MFKFFPKLMIGASISICRLALRHPLLMVVWGAMTAALVVVNESVSFISDVQMPPPGESIGPYILLAMLNQALSGACTSLTVVAFCLLSLLTAICVKTNKKTSVSAELYMFLDYFAPFFKGVFVPIFVASLTFTPALIFMSSNGVSNEIPNSNAEQHESLYWFLSSISGVLVAILSAAYAITLLSVPGFRKVVHVTQGLSLLFSHQGKSIFCLFAVFSGIAAMVNVHLGIGMNGTVFCALGCFLVVPVFVRME